MITEQAYQAMSASVQMAYGLITNMATATYPTEADEKKHDDFVMSCMVNLISNFILDTSAEGKRDENLESVISQIKKHWAMVDKAIKNYKEKEAH